MQEKCSPPEMPGLISGPKYGQCGASGVEYSLSLVSGATKYQWAISDTNYAVIVGNDSIDTIALNFADSLDSVVVGVIAVNSCGATGESTITIYGRPDLPSVPAGNKSVCSSSNEKYSTLGASGATSYVWTIPSGASIIGSDKGDTIVVHWGSTSGNVSVRAVNACGNSGDSSLAVVVNACRVANHNSQSISIDAYPNPSSGIINLDVKQSVSADIEVNVYDIFGRLVLNRDITKPGNSFILNFDSFDKGTYFVKVITANEQEIIKIAIE
ncbi:MAG: T9SS type A sorting domain-containing protein [Bacteroidota bacterium]